MSDAITPLWLTVKQTAQVLQLSEDKIYELVHRADFPARRVGRAIRIDRRRLEEWASDYAGKAEKDETKSFPSLVYQENGGKTR